MYLCQRWFSLLFFKRGSLWSLEGKLPHPYCLFHYFCSSVTECILGVKAVPAYGDAVKMTIICFVCPLYFHDSPSVPFVHLNQYSVFCCCSKYFGSIVLLSFLAMKLGSCLPLILLLCCYVVEMRCLQISNNVPASM